MGRMKLTEVMSRYIDNFNSSMIHRDVPVQVSPVKDVPVIAAKKWSWEQTGNTLTKTFRFSSVDKKTSFCMWLLSYENETKRTAVWAINRIDVKITVVSDLTALTDREIEYIKTADRLFRDIELDQLVDFNRAYGKSRF